ncbi:MAG: RadC family protein [Myxococcales bacterium]
MPQDLRILEQGPEGLTDIDLLATLLPRSSRRFGPEEIAARVLSMGLAALRRACAYDLVSIDGVRERDAARVLAALELGRRVAQASVQRRERLVEASDIAALLAPRLSHLAHEEFWAVLLTSRLEEVRSVPIARGGLTQCSVLPREAFAPAILHRVPRIAFAHNHPSGDPHPSADDVRLGAALDDAGRTLGIEVVDHLVIADGAFHSARHGAGLLTSPAAAA